MSKLMSIALILMLLCACTTTGIHKALFNDDLEQVRRFANDGKINERQGRLDQSPLLAAAYYDKKKMVQYLCELGAEVNDRDKNGQTALMYAATYRFYELADFLLSRGADLNIKDNDGHTALYHAKYNRSYRIVDILEEKGASIGSTQ